MKKIFLCLVLATVVSGSAGCKKEEPTQVTAAASSEYNFEDGISGWTPLGKTQVTQSADKLHSGKASLKISGTANAGLWSFAKSGRINVTPGKRYKLSGWMLVESISQNSAGFKCEFRQGKKWLKNSEVEFYNMKNKGAWQESSVEFIVPEGTNISLNIAIDKRPQDQAVEGTIYIDDLKLEQLD